MGCLRGFICSVGMEKWNIPLLRGPWEPVAHWVRCRYDALLKIFCPCMSHLVAIVRDERKLNEKISLLLLKTEWEGEFELPTRLSVAAADLILSLTEALTRSDSVFSVCILFNIA
ncbi:hypothetical protein RND71_014915 [Anisodus tanguticus]|uniref:Uncharacterized protein n=1 Tax=Anisodus tanguticus TaxID=243964 RepID=A0AAE1SBH7_9SOLA|nr:hypothetical protein RND71_014915 [Anisodus tanguticus]